MTVLSLERLHLLAERGLLHVQPLRGAREAALLRDGDEIAQVPELDGICHRPIISQPPVNNIGAIGTRGVASKRGGDHPPPPPPEMP